MEKHKAVDFLRNTGLEPLEKHKATDADGGPFWLQGICFLKNTGMVPLLKMNMKIDVKTADLDSPRGSSLFLGKFIAMNTIK